MKDLLIREQSAQLEELYGEYNWEQLELKAIERVEHQEMLRKEQMFDEYLEQERKENKDAHGHDK
tara:strand:+ start:326 stop:520 length:195 start_codon:yes stop_codon:yes gene_type:complete